MPELKIGAKIIKRSKNKLLVLNPDVPDHATYTYSWNISQKLHLPCGTALDAAQIFQQPAVLDKLAQQQVTVRAGVLGRKAKKIFQQYSIPPWERGAYPLVFANDRLVSIVGLWCSPRI
jgi:tRNA(Ile)-lysidine synthetase-like protein